MKNSRPINIFVVEPRNSGGMIHYAYQLCTALSEEGAKVTLITAQEYEMENFPHNFHVEKMLNLWSRIDNRANTPPKNRLEALWKKTFWTTRRIIRGTKLILSWLALIKYLRQHKPDITQFGSIDFPFESIFLRYLNKKGLVLTQICHEFEDRERDRGFLNSFEHKMETLVYKNFDVLFFHAQNNLDRFKSLYPDTTSHVHVIPMGNEQLFPTPDNLSLATETLKKRYKINEGTYTILFFGTLTPSKGLHDLITAFTLIYKRRKDTRLLIAGAPGAHIQLQDYLDLIKQLDIEDGVIFDTRYIPIEEVAPLITLASVVVYPYLNSTQSAALQVAYTFSRPVITTNVGGLPEAVVDGKSGFLIPPAQPEILANTMFKFIEEPQLTQKMGGFAKTLSETRFAWRPIAKKILLAYQSRL